MRASGGEWDRAGEPGERRSVGVGVGRRRLSPPGAGRCRKISFRPPAPPLIRVRSKLLIFNSLDTFGVRSTLSSEHKHRDTKHGMPVDPGCSPGQCHSVRTSPPARLRVRGPADVTAGTDDSPALARRVVPACSRNPGDCAHDCQCQRTRRVPLKLTDDARGQSERGPLAEAS